MNINHTDSPFMSERTPLVKIEDPSLLLSPASEEVVRVKQSVAASELDTVEVGQHEHNVGFRSYSTHPNIISPFLVICFILGLLFTIAAVITRFTAEDHGLWGVQIWRYLLWGAILNFSLAVLLVIVRFSWFLLENALFYTTFFYFIHSLEYPTVLLIWSISHFFLWPTILGLGDNGNPLDKYTNFLKSMEVVLMIGVSYFVLQVLTKATIAYIQEKDFWPQLNDYVFKEKVFDRLVLDKPRGLQRILGIFRTHPTPLNTIYNDDSVHGKEASFQRAFKIAKLVFERLDLDHEGDVTYQEVRPYFDGEAEARRAFRVFDKDNNGSISFEEMTKTIVEIYRDRKDLFTTLYDRENVAEILANVFQFIYWIIIVLVSISIFKEGALKEALTPLAGAVLALTFVFGNSLKNIWESMLLIFVIKPFSVGDRLTLNGFPTMKVNRLRLFTTEFYAMDGRQFIVPNSFLVTNTITQYKRSRDFAASFKLQVSGNTMSSAKFKKFTSTLKTWLKNDDANWNHHKFQCFISEFEETHIFILEVWAELKGLTWNEPSKFRVPRTRLFFAIQDTCKQLGIECHRAPQIILNKHLSDEEYEKIEKLE